MNFCYEKYRSYNLLFFFLSIMTGGCLSVFLQYEISWDFANYHYYNPWAFLNDRMGYDIAAGALNSYLNPLMDIPLYLLIKYFNDYPKFIMFMQGIWAGLLLFSFFKLAVLYFDRDSLKGKIGIFLTLLIALTGNAFFLQIGTSSNEIPIAFLVMTALYLLIKDIFFDKRSRLWIFIVAGFLLGSAMGLKLTGVIYCLSIGLSLILFYKQIEKPWQKISLFALAGLCGFLVFNGFWMWKMWQEFQNPFFPFANELFKSEFLLYENLRDTTFLPQDWKQIWFWPLFLSFKFLFTPFGMITIDYRPALVFILFIIYVLKKLVCYIRCKKVEIKPDFAFLIIFTLISFILWEAIFSITRYYIVIEMIGAIFIVKAIWRYSFRSFIAEVLYYTFVVLMLFVLVTTPYFSDSWGSRNEINQTSFDKERFVNVENVNIPNDTLLLLYSYPVSMAIPFLAERTENLRAIVFREKMKYTNSEKDVFDLPKWKLITDKIYEDHRGPKFALFAFSRGYQINVRNAFNDMKCRFLDNNIGIQWYLCVPPEWQDYVWD